MTYAASIAWNNASRQGWQLFCALLPCVLTLLAVHPHALKIVFITFTASLFCQLTAGLLVSGFDLSGSPVSTLAVSAALTGKFFFNALLLALSLGLLVSFPSNENVISSSANVLPLFLNSPEALGILAALIAFLGIQPLFNKLEAGVFSLPALTLVFAIALAGLSRAPMLPAATPVLFALIICVCWLCWLRLLRLLPIASFFITVVVAYFLFEPDSIMEGLTKHGATFAITPLLIARLELSPSSNNEACLAGFITGLVYTQLSLVQGALYSPLFALCIASLFTTATLPFLSSLLAQVAHGLSRTGMSLAILVFSMSTLLLLRWLAGTEESLFMTDNKASDLITMTLFPLGLAGMAWASALLTHFLAPSYRRWAAKRRLLQREAIEASGQTMLRARVTGALHSTSKE